MTNVWGTHTQFGAPTAYVHRGHPGGGRQELLQGWGRSQPRCSEPPRRVAGVPQLRSLFCPVIAIGMQQPDGPAGDDVLLQVRQKMYELLAAAFDEAGVGWMDCAHEGRGDVVVIAVPPEVPPEVLLDELVTRLRAGLRLHNKLSSEIARIRLRMAVHVGHCTFSATGMTGYALSWLTALLDAPAFVREFTAALTDLGLVASDYLYDELIQHGPGLIDPAAYDPIAVPGTRTQGAAWVHFPARPPRPPRPVRPAPDPMPAATPAGAPDMSLCERRNDGSGVRRRTIVRAEILPR
jgi:hypothetical protein